MFSLSHSLYKRITFRQRYKSRWSFSYRIKFTIFLQASRRQKKTMESVLKYLKYLSFLDRFPDLKSCAEEIGWLLFRFWLIAAFAGNGIGCVLNRNTRILCKIIPETYGAHLSIFIEKAKAQKPKTFQYPLFHQPLHKGFSPYYVSWTEPPPPSSSAATSFPRRCPGLRKPEGSSGALVRIMCV